jgi:hypothetical protein
VCVHTYIHTYILYILYNIRTYYIYIYIYVCVSVSVSVSVCVRCMCACACVCVYIDTYIRMYIHRLRALRGQLAARDRFQRNDRAQDRRRAAVGVVRGGEPPRGVASHH